MKKIFVVLAMMLLVFPAFAEGGSAQGKRVALTFDPTPIFFPSMMGGAGVGVGLEIAPIPSFSIKGNFYYVSFDWGKVSTGGVDDGDNDSKDVREKYSFYYYNVGARWYPDDNYIEGFFLGFGFQQHHLVDVFNSENLEGAETLGFYFGIGNKSVIGNGPVRFVLEPWIDFLWSIKSDVLSTARDPLERWFLGTLMGLQGIRGGLLLGMSF